METKLLKTKKTVSSTEGGDILSIVNHILQEEHNHNHIMGAGACKVAGCGCPKYIDSEGTCFNTNSAGGTCNHLESDHQ